ncbi:FAD-dependent oxidoreductase, partial [Dactylosporangium sp. NPDC051485]|uniref:FAD-dependent oxidoreductase n=1 Tax=Dactylosporangium sp. NPDC051485 TaxID=3154846 RepID=UPI003438452D
GPIGADAVVAAAGTGVAGLCDLPVAASPAVLVRIPAPRGLVRTVFAAPGFEVRERDGGGLLAAAGCPDGPQEAGHRAARAVAAAFRGTPDGPDAVHVGLRPMPADRAPIVGPVAGLPGLYAAVMHSGVTLAPVIGDLVATEVVDGAPAAALAGCRPERYDAAGTRGER